MRSLLPRPRPENLDTGSLVSLDEIVAEFQRYREAARLLSDMEARRRDLFPRAGGSRVEIETRGDVLLLTSAFRTIVGRFAPRDDWVVGRVELHIEETLAELRRRIGEQRVIDLAEYLAGLSDIKQVIITFLAALELVRLGELRVSQDEVTGAIYLFRRRVRVGHATTDPPVSAEKTAGLVPDREPASGNATVEGQPIPAGEPAV
jgi:segregation and condensation protein A